MNARGLATRSMSARPVPSLTMRPMGWLAGLLAMTLLALGPALAEDDTEQAPSGEARYRIGVGDVLDVHIYEEQMQQECVVRPDGRITLPLIGDVPAAGATPPELAARVANKLEPYQESPTVTVAVREIHSYRVYVLGEVSAQQMIESNTPLKLLEALAIAGGFNEWAKREILVLRGSGEQARRFEIDYEEIVEGRALEDNLQLESGDMVVVR